MNSKQKASITRHLVQLNFDDVTAMIEAVKQFMPDEKSESLLALLKVITSALEPPRLKDQQMDLFQVNDAGARPIAPWNRPWF